MTGANIGRALAIVLNGRVLSAPVIQSRITDSAIIEGGGLGMLEIQDLATVLLSGALPAPVTVVEEAPGSSR
jgi:preprotein translocase subunit SecD